MDNTIKRKFNFPEEPKLFKKIILDSIGLWNQPRVIVEDKPTIVGPLNMLRYVFSHKASGVNKCLRDLLINAINDANQAQSPAGSYITKFLVGDFEIKNHRRVSSQKAHDITLDMMVNQRAKNIFRHTLDLVGPQCRINIKKWDGINDIIEFSSGYNFPVQVDPGFSSAVNCESFSLSNSNVLIIEGSPNSVSDLDKFLTYIHDSKVPAVVIARSFPEEVIATLAINWKRGSLKILPLLYGKTIETINIPADISSISGAVPVSKEFGDVISAIDYSKLGFVEKVEINGNNLNISSNISPSNQIKRLFKQLETKTGEAQSILSDRISNLTANLLTIKLSNEKFDTHIVQEELDMAVLGYSSICKYGIIDAVRNGKTEFSGSMAAIKAAKNHSRVFNNQIKSIGGFLLEV